ncbi:hypothetical protein KGQ20_42515 [Catenulispora sp. NF23]|uniref:Uncharacterized protein n=1 Tax=Catenulispora pinistramenti TaxID=2705254 RepID=A0ABS5L6N6_9ACTN|nr:hypothetical protein [Catenulispora pinistramenti]MBS2539439.1 hypothetical protein [Catenulispora pinistramenti]MBS2553972.1 hypothetical protein [Catenulispora pinistramenti]
MSDIERTDLNRLRDIIRSAQQEGQQYPVDPKARISVGSEGEIYTGPAPTGQPLSKVQHGTFAARVRGREVEDLRWAAQHMPHNTRFIDHRDARGWCYTFLSQMGRSYTMFAYFDGISYQVKLVEPRLEGLVGVHTGHLFANGKLCLSQAGGSGQPTLEEAYSKSVLWATGMDVVLAGHPFPFSVNNEFEYGL